jgi:hypothetical protein
MNKSIELLREEFLDAKREVKFAESNLDDAKKALLKATEAAGDEYEIGDEVIRVVRPEKKTWDWDKVRSNVGELQFKKISRLVVDENLLNEALASGTIKPSALKGCVTEKAGTAYVRIYKKKEEEDDEDF